MTVWPMETVSARRLDMSRTTLRRILAPRGQQWQAILTRIECAGAAEDGEPR